MQKVKSLFLLFILALLVLPWFDFGQARIVGVEANVIRPSFSWKTYLNGTFQKEMEKWWNRTFGSRNTMLVAKNTVYDVLNVGQFHSGYFSSIKQGRHGVLFLSEYIQSKFLSYDVQVMRGIAEQTANSLKKLKDKLNYLGVDLLFVMAPSKADVRESDLPFIYTFREKYVSTPASLYPIWEKAFDQRGIAYINSFDVLKQKGLPKESFPDTGIHWSMYGAALVWEECSAFLNQINSIYPKLRVLGNRETDKAYAAERDIADLMNIRPRYYGGRKTWSVAEYEANQSVHPINSVAIGDSFTRQLYFNIIQSRFSNVDSCALYENRLPTKEQWFDIIKKNKIVILNYTYPQFRGWRIKNEVERLLSYIEDIQLLNWHPYEPWGNAQWSKDVSEVEFVNHTNGDYRLSFDLKFNYHTEKLIFKINGDVICEMIVKNNNGIKNILIPSHKIKKGINKIGIISINASNPVVMEQHYHNNRTLGAYISNIEVKVCR